MPREATITYDQVVRYAEAIKAEGGKPTPRQIRDRHGSGSFGTIHKLFQQWESTQALAIEAALSLPPSVQRAILEFVRHELLVGRADLEERLCQATACAEDLATENERQAVLIDEQLATIESLRGEKAALTGRLAEIETAIGTHREDSARERQAAEAARTEVAKLMLRLEGVPRLEAELGELRKECQLIDRSRQEVAKELAVSRAAYQSLELSKSEAVANLQSRLADAQEELRAVSTQLQAAQTERLKAAAELASAHAMRADEGQRVAERIGVLEGSLAVLQQGGAASLQHNPS
ncbi:DNA-binding protein [Azonexus fungiphilus]|uniref:DNA-binding protein n=1 Tax=Azonexus fungiphilus TaxID=146940 RepID=UPI00156B3B83|nr:DNA-binding protein [Azonexus fungiphilus]NHC07894.1 mucin-associated surface protein [Azonexus fungiphilus]